MSHRHQDPSFQSPALGPGGRNVTSTKKQEEHEQGLQALLFKHTSTLLRILSRAQVCRQTGFPGSFLHFRSPLLTSSSWMNLLFFSSTSYPRLLWTTRLNSFLSAHLPLQKKERRQKLLKKHSSCPSVHQLQYFFFWEMFTGWFIAQYTFIKWVERRITTDFDEDGSFY